MLFFDTVVSWDVIEHISKETELEMIRERRRVMKEGGVFYLSTPYKSIRGRILDPAWWLIGHRHYSEKDKGINTLFIRGKKKDKECIVE